MKANWNIRFSLKNSRSLHDCLYSAINTKVIKTFVWRCYSELEKKQNTGNTSSEASQQIFAVARENLPSHKKKFNVSPTKSSCQCYGFDSETEDSVAQWHGAETPLFLVTVKLGHISMNYLNYCLEICMHTFALIIFYTCKFQLIFNRIYGNKRYIETKPAVHRTAIGSRAFSAWLIGLYSINDFLVVFQLCLVICIT